MFANIGPISKYCIRIFSQREHLVLWLDLQSSQNVTTCCSLTSFSPPAQKTPEDVNNFDPDFTQEEPTLTPIDEPFLPSINQEEFLNFSFTSPELLEGFGTPHWQYQRWTLTWCWLTARNDWQFQAVTFPSHVRGPAWREVSRSAAHKPRSLKHCYDSRNNVPKELFYLDMFLLFCLDC